MIMSAISHIFCSFRSLHKVSIVLLCLNLAACSSEESSTDAPPAEDEKAPALQDTQSSEVAPPAEDKKASALQDTQSFEAAPPAGDENAPTLQDAQIYFNDALKEFYKEDYGRSEVALQKAIKIVPNDINAYNLLGAIKTKQKEYKEARSAFYQALDIDPTYFPSRYNIGELDFLQGNFQAAYDYFKKLQADYSNNELIAFKLVLLNLKLDRKTEAEAEFKKLSYPGDTAAWFYAQAALSVFEGNKKAARKFIASAKTFYPDNQEENIFIDSLKEAELSP